MYFSLFYLSELGEILYKYNLWDNMGKMYKVLLLKNWWQHYFINILLSLTLFGTILHLTFPISDTGKTLKSNWIYLGYSVYTLTLQLIYKYICNIALSENCSISVSITKEFLHVLSSIHGALWFYLYLYYIWNDWQEQLHCVMQIIIFYNYFHPSLPTLVTWW